MLSEDVVPSSAIVPPIASVGDALAPAVGPPAGEDAVIVTAAVAVPTLFVTARLNVYAPATSGANVALALDAEKIDALVIALPAGFEPSVHA